MATLTRTTTPDEDTALKAAYDRYVAQSGDASLTVKDFALRVLDQWIAARVQDYKDSQRQTKGQLYQQATPADQATIDSILAKYAT